MTQHKVEFWPMQAQDVRANTKSHEVLCDSMEEAIALEAAFHAQGWAARAVTLTVSRSFPTAGAVRNIRTA